MPLTDIAVPLSTAALPADVLEFLEEADDRIDEFQRETRVPAFVPSNYPGAYAVLKGLIASPKLRGNRFCEWGSGFGVVACLAAELGFEAYGIEIDGELVAAARRLAEDYHFEAEFAQGSFVPRGGDDRVHAAGSYAWLTTDSDFVYSDLGHTPDDFDLIFAYPWPDEEAVTADLFERFAGTGALLATYTGEGFRVRRKVGNRSSKRR